MRVGSVSNRGSSTLVGVRHRQSCRAPVPRRGSLRRYTPLKSEAPVEGGREAAPDLVVVGELGEVLMGEVGGAVQLLRSEQVEDLGLLALTAGVDRR
jgi:hypothetical protein